MGRGNRSVLTILFVISLIYGIYTLGGATLIALAGEEEGLYQAYQVASLSACAMLGAIALAIMIRPNNSTPLPYPHQTHHPQQHVPQSRQHPAHPPQHAAPHQGQGAPMQHPSAPQHGHGRHAG